MFSEEEVINQSPDNQSVRLLGLDFGSTTSSMMLAEVSVGQHSLTGRMGFGDPRILAKSEPVFTPFNGDQLDSDRLECLLDTWLADSSLASTPAFAGAALITGLAARSDNALSISERIRERIGDSLIATADDPRLESWLAFMGNCATLSRARGSQPVINLDIGGGTTNPALGIAGSVHNCGCHYIGARHIRFKPGSYVIEGISSFGRKLLELLGINRSAGDELSPPEVERITGWMVRGLEAMVTPGDRWFQTPEYLEFQQVAFSPLPPKIAPQNGIQRAPLITFSGGVGELIYRFMEQDRWPETTAYGDLGIDLAQAIVRSPLLNQTLDVKPETAGRATVMGLTLHSSEISGTSLYLPDAELLPLKDLPIIARLPIDAAPSQLDSALSLATSSPQGACLQLEANEPLGLQELRNLGSNIKDALIRIEFPENLPLVLLMENNSGKTLGHYITDWGKHPLKLLVIDEISNRDAQFIHIGQPHQQVVPVSFFGMK